MKIFDRIKLFIQAIIQIHRLKKNLKHKIYNKDIFLIGSAPNPNLELYNSTMGVMTVNASALNVQKLKLNTPVVSIIENEIINNDINFTKLARYIVVRDKLLEQVKMGAVVVVQSYESRWGDLEQLNSIYDTNLKLNRYAKSWIVAVTIRSTKFGIGTENLYSTGGFAMVIANYLGCASLTISGFSLLKTRVNKADNLYFYDFPKAMINDQNNVIKDSVSVRAHSMADLYIITSLIMTGKIISTRECDFLPAITNNGIE